MRKMRWTSLKRGQHMEQAKIPSEIVIRGPSTQHPSSKVSKDGASSLVGQTGIFSTLFASFCTLLRRSAAAMFQNPSLPQKNLSRKTLLRRACTSSRFPRCTNNQSTTVQMIGATMPVSQAGQLSIFMHGINSGSRVSLNH